MKHLTSPITQLGMIVSDSLNCVLEILEDETVCVRVFDHNGLRNRVTANANRHFLELLGGPESAINKMKIIESVDEIKPFVKLLSEKKEAALAEKRAKEAARKEAAIKSVEKPYNDLINKYQVIPVTLDHIRIVLNYFRAFECWNHPDFPQFEVGYSMNWYDCGGRNGIAIRFDKRIKVENGSESRFCIAPRSYLTKYWHM